VEIVWSGAAYREGRAPSLSSHHGQSSLHNPRTRAARTVPPWLLTDYERERARQDKYQRRPEIKLKRRAAYLRRKERNNQPCPAIA